ncbi:zinc-ribbon domain containing protein [Chloroflexota bacterium]
MSFQDKYIQCVDCGNTFTFTAEEQDIFKPRGYTSEPKHYPECR